MQHLGGDRWKVVVYAGREHGRQVQRTRTFRAKGVQEATRIADRMRHELRENVKESAARRDTVAGVAADWLTLKRDRGRSPSTLANYERIVKDIVREFGKVKVAELTGRDIDRWYSKLAKAKSPANILHYHSVLRAILRQAHKWGLVVSPATEATTPPSRTRVELSLPTSQALALVVDQAEGEFRVALELFAATGMRRGEVVGLQWSDLRPDGLHVRRSLLDVKGHAGAVKSTKGGRERVVELDARTAAIMDGWRRELRERCAQLRQETRWVFPDLRKDATGRTPHAPSWLSAQWHRARKAHGITARLHDIRHWHASSLIAEGVPITEVSKRIGHAQVTTTMAIYAHVLPGERGQSADAIASVLERARGNIVDT